MTTDALEALQSLGRRLLADGDGLFTSAVTAFGELTLTAPAARVVEALERLRDDPDARFVQLIDLCGVDYPDRKARFEVVYHLLSFSKNQRARLKVEIAEDAAVPSAVPVHPCADWFEREAFDMYGIFFEGHPDLRRILTDYGFHGHPLRKDFPMTGYVEVRWDEALKRVVYEPVKLPAEYRSFDFLSPWEGARAVGDAGNAVRLLPGDEKAAAEAGPAPKEGA